MLQTIKQKINSWQTPQASSQELILNRRRVYIIPNKAGLVYTLLLLIIFITSINYSLNLGYALDFVLIACGWLAINLTFRNLSGTGLSASASPAVYLGELAHFSLYLTNRSKRARYALHLGFDRSAMQVIDIPEFSNRSVALATPTLQRGWMACPRIRIETTFPYGLLTAWSYWRTTQRVLVYPTPEVNPPALPFATQGETGSEATAGNDEFAGVRNFQAGDSLKLLAWRHMARQSAAGLDVLISKNFEGGQRRICAIDFAALPASLNTEQKLSRLCAWLLTAERTQVRYAFRLGAAQYEQNSGEDHLLLCLTALALYGRTQHE